MYTVEPYLNFHENIPPPDVMYSVKSYHDVSHTSGLMGNITSSVQSSMEESLKEIINRNQLKLIEELAAFVDHLNKALISSSAKVETTFRERRNFPHVLQQQFAFRKGKVDTSPKEVGAYCPPALAVFATVKYPMNTITLIGDTKVLWLRNLAKVGARTSILFEGLNDGISSPRCTIKLQTSNSNKSLVAEVNGTKLSEHISVWKLLGSLTSLYSIAPEHAEICTHIDYWLLLIDDVLSNKSNENNLCRQMCTALGHHDYLVSYVAATLADVLAYSVITKQSYYANNVELWLRRMDKLFQ
ncbi:hypothetical protein LOAG_00277 [Loa loa]|nr:hypothetical protein LOAG_00277 [Loa loa]EFO28219.1 hypothetical protein LOAG_00277 [Loa loa]